MTNLSPGSDRFAIAVMEAWRTLAVSWIAPPLREPMEEKAVRVAIARQMLGSGATMEDAAEAAGYTNVRSLRRVLRDR